MASLCSSHDKKPLHSFKSRRVGSPSTCVGGSFMFLLMLSTKLSNVTPFKTLISQWIILFCLCNLCHMVWMHQAPLCNFCHTVRFMLDVLHRAPHIKISAKLGFSTHGQLLTLRFLGHNSIHKLLLVISENKP